MKQLFNPADTREILERLEKLTPHAQAQWGKMNVAQMVSHCRKGLEMAIGTIHPKRIFIGILIGGFLQSKYTDEKPFDRGSPTSKELKITGQPNFDEPEALDIDAFTSDLVKLKNGASYERAEYNFNVPNWTLSRVPATVAGRVAPTRIYCLIEKFAE